MGTGFGILTGAVPWGVDFCFALCYIEGRRWVGVVYKRGKKRGGFMEVEIDNIKMTIKLKITPAKKQK